VVDFCEHGNEHFVFIKCWEFVDSLGILLLVLVIMEGTGMITPTCVCRTKYFTSVGCCQLLLQPGSWQ
jgi:hypothetical protein